MSQVMGLSIGSCPLVPCKMLEDSESMMQSLSVMAAGIIMPTRGRRSFTTVSYSEQVGEHEAPLGGEAGLLRLIAASLFHLDNGCMFGAQLNRFRYASSGEHEVELTYCCLLRGARGEAAAQRPVGAWR